MNLTDSMSSASSRVGILIIENHAMFAEALGMKLTEHYDCKVDLCEDVGSARKFFKSWRFDVVLMSVSLPNQSGVAAISDVVRMAEGAPILVLTEWMSNFAALAYDAAGCKRCVSKHESLDSLLKSVECLVPGMLAPPNKLHVANANEILSKEEG